jgi:hypothetical protein
MPLPLPHSVCVIRDKKGGQTNAPTTLFCNLFEDSTVAGKDKIKYRIYKIKICASGGLTIDSVAFYYSVAPSPQINTVLQYKWVGGE